MLYDTLFKPAIAIFIDLYVKIKLNEGWDLRTAHVNAYIMYFQELSPKEIHELSKDFFILEETKAGLSTQELKGYYLYDQDNQDQLQESQPEKTEIGLSTIYKCLDYLIKGGNVHKTENRTIKYGYKYKIGGIEEFYFINPVMKAIYLSRVDHDIFSMVLAFSKDNFSKLTKKTNLILSNLILRQDLATKFINRLNVYIRYYESYKEIWQNFQDSIINSISNVDNILKKIEQEKANYITLLNSNFNLKPFGDDIKTDFILFYQNFQKMYTNLFRNCKYSEADAKLICSMMFFGPLIQDEIHLFTGLSRGKISQGLTQLIDEHQVVKKKISKIRKPLYDLRGSQYLFQKLVISDYIRISMIQKYMKKLGKSFKEIDNISKSKNIEMELLAGYSNYKKFTNFCYFVEPLFKSIYEKYKLTGMAAKIDFNRIKL